MVSDPSDHTGSDETPTNLLTPATAVQSARTTEPADPAPRRLGPYAVIDELGRGGMGRVYRAFDTRLQREVALKLLRARIRRLGDLDARMTREARALARLSHPNVVDVYDVGRIGDQVYIAMEYVPGPTLKQWLKKARTWQEIVPVFLDAARGLSAAHDVGFIHRDFKPANVLIGPDGRARVMDFGLVKEGPATGSEHTPGQSHHGSDELTEAGTVMGTLPYMSPEQHEEAALDARSDQYAFCVSLFEALAQKRPFEGKGSKLVQAKRTQRPTLPPRVPRWLRRLVARGLAPDPRERWPSMRSIIVVLERGGDAVARRWAVAGITTVALGGLVWSTNTLRRPEVCDDARAKLAAVWNGDVRSEIEQAFSRSGTPIAGGSAELVAQRLDAWGQSWIAVHEDTCSVATRAQPYAKVTDARFDCIFRALTEAKAVTEVLTRADRGVVERAASTVAALPDPRRCSDDDTLLADVQLPDDPVQRARVEGARTSLARVTALRNAGKYDAAAEALVQVRAMMHGLDHGPLRAEVELEAAQVESARGNVDAAQQGFERAFFVAQRSGSDSTAAAAATSLAYLVGYRLEQPDEGLRWADHADAAIRRGGGVRRRAAWASVKGTILFGQGKLDDAETLYREALDIWQTQPDDQANNVATSYLNLAGVRFEQADYEEAADLYLRAHELQVQVLGADHPRVSLALANLAASLHAQGKYDEALRYHRRALALREQWLDGDHPDIAATLDGMGSTFYMLGRYDEAEQHYRRALEIREASLGRDHPRVAMSLGNLALAVTEQGKTREALDLYARAIAIIEETKGTEHLDASAPLVNVGVLYVDLGRLDEAERAFRRAYDIRLTALGDDHPDVALAAINLGDVLRRKGDLDAAFPLLRQSVTIRSRDDIPPADLARSLAALAHALLDADRPTEARPHLERARTLDLPEDAAATRAILDFATARLALHEGRTNEALRLARQARTTLRDENSSAAHEVDQWLRHHQPPPTDPPPHKR